MRILMLRRTGISYNTERKWPNKKLPPFSYLLFSTLVPGLFYEKLMISYIGQDKGVFYQ